MRKVLTALSLVFICFLPQSCSKETEEKEPVAEEPIYVDRVDIQSEVLEDKIRGGLLSQIIGNLNGLPHEFKYIDEPGAVENYTPSLAEGARTDDDTDIEWVYIVEMQRSGEVFIPAERISQIWKEHINRKIWCANVYARQLMNLGLDPPLTGRIALNPWSIFNISGQFICESFGLIAPAMPQSAAMLGLNYTHVTIDGEPAQATQLFTSMIATAFIESDLEKIIEAGLDAIDPESEIYSIVTQVRSWCKENPDWRVTRAKIKDKYSRYGGEPARDGNGYELNTSSTVAALIYGGGDLAETLRIAFNFGWDADNNAATAATIIGVIKGLKWIKAQGWAIKDIYRNETRDSMPEDETITSFGDRLVDIAGRVILQYGGEEVSSGAGKIFRIHVQRPVNVEPLPEPLDRLEELREQLLPEVESGLSGSSQERARAAYLALCLGEAERLRLERSSEWKQALRALRNYPELLKLVFEAPEHSGEKITARAKAEGLKKPK
ncbi:MAG TPA: ADP-ribosylglycohydrolase family protein [archaeon]|nr:ADP-ribosylglycohydrolase family protein [archaeon]